MVMYVLLPYVTGTLLRIAASSPTEEQQQQYIIATHHPPPIASERTKMTALRFVKSVCDACLYLSVLY